MPKPTFFNLAEEKRNHVLEVAIDEFAEHGYKGASISRLVATAGIAKGSFYQYFADKDDLYSYIVRTFIADRKLEVYQEEVGKLKEMNLTEYLRLVFHRQVAEFLEQPKLMKIGVDMIQIVDQPVYQKIMKEYQGVAGTYYIPFIQHEVAEGQLDPKVNVQLLNFMLVSLGQYMLYRYTITDVVDISGALVDEIVDDLEYILTNGIYGGTAG